MSATRVLVVDDEKPLREFIGRNLAARGFHVYYASSGLEALALFNTESLDLIIMDVMMPHMDGLETSRRIRQSSTVPIIVLTALDEESDKVMALDMGVDDYLTKPFGVDELLARVRAVLRRSSWSSAPASSAREILRYGEIELNSEAQTAVCRGQRLKLTRTEFDLLHYFMRNVGKALPHRAILQNVWGPEYGGEAEYLRVYIGRLRRKIEKDPSNPIYLQTEYGIGYRFGN
ncbi:MAG: response regulator [Chloroflexi bacterium]|jgi:two-component system KDP operon response regulator KdpE|nr:response regulator [Chloroflexota bacterium]